MEYLILLVLAIPLAAIIWLIISIIKFTKNKDDVVERKKYVKQIIISSIIIGVWILAVIGFFAFLFYALTVYGM